MTARRRTLLPLYLFPSLLVSLPLLLASTAHAHRTDEYLQDTTFLVEQRQLTAWIRLTPGSDLLPQILPLIDTNSDGRISPAEQSAYAQRVLNDLTLTLDDHPLTPRLASFSFPSIDEMKEGVGEILLVFTTPLPAPTTPTRRLTYDNRHQPRYGAYLVNALVPDDPGIHIQSQSRSYNQSRYALTFTQPSSTVAAAASPALITRFAASTITVLACIALLRHRKNPPAPARR